jgi:hypothetical protein
MTLKDMVVEIAPGVVKYNTWAFDGHGTPFSVERSGSSRNGEKY